MADQNIEIDEEEEEATPYHNYEIASYPTDFPLTTLDDMWHAGDIVVPEFQRNFVWTIKQSSLLIESFLLGLPVPQAFFYIDEDNKCLVIDGQQRISSVVFFFEGYFGDENLGGRRKVFRLEGLDEKSPYRNKRFEDLTEPDQRKLRQTILRVINVRQLAPKKDNTSIYHIFERLNTGGTPLKPQEIRNCVFHGPIVAHLDKLNSLTLWRNVVGKTKFDKHQKDAELILRIFAMTYDSGQYEKPMKEFLNKRMSKSRNANDKDIDKFVVDFPRALEFIDKNLPPQPFHVRGPLNLAAADSIISVIIRNLGKLKKNFQECYGALILDPSFQSAIFFNTSDGVAVAQRIKLAEEYLVK